MHARARRHGSSRERGGRRPRRQQGDATRHDQLEPALLAAVLAGVGIVARLGSLVVPSEAERCNVANRELFALLLVARLHGGSCVSPAVISHGGIAAPSPLPGHLNARCARARPSIASDVGQRLFNRGVVSAGTCRPSGTCVVAGRRLERQLGWNRGRGAPRRRRRRRGARGLLRLSGDMMCATVSDRAGADVVSAGRRRCKGSPARTYPTLHVLLASTGTQGKTSPPSKEASRSSPAGRRSSPSYQPTVLRAVEAPSPAPTPLPVSDIGRAAQK